MELNAASIEAANTGYKAVFLGALGTPVLVYMALCATLPMSSSIEKLEIVDALGGMREWIGEREVGNLKSFEHTITNGKYEQTVGINRDALEDDNLGVYNQQIMAMGVNAARLPDTLLLAKLKKGFTEKTWDGKTFFSATHKSGTNLIAGPLNTANFEKARQQLETMKRMDGKEYINVLAFGGAPVLTVAPNLRATAQKILKAQLIDGGDSNVNYEAAEIRVLPGLPDDYWFLSVEGGALKPFIFADRTPTEWTAHTDPEANSKVFMTDQLLYGTRRRCGIAYGFHQLIVGSTGS